jgi:transketolase
LDSAAVIMSVAKTGCAVTAEEHMKHGGLGDSICQLLAERRPAPVEYVAVDDRFGESGTPEELMVKYGLTAENIVAAALRAVQRKG